MGTKSRLKIAPAPTTGVADRTGQELQTLPADGSAPKNRLKDAQSMYRLYQRLADADRISTNNRLVLEAMRDGAPPLDEDAQRRAGRSWEYNLNFLEADARMATALATFDDLVDSNENLVIPDLRPSEVPDEEAADVSDVIAEEHGKLIREHSDFYGQWSILEGQFVGHAVGFAYFPDGETPWWQAAGWDKMKMPRKTRIGEDNVPILTWLKPYLVHDLYAKISDGPEYSPKWNHDEVKKAIVRAAKGYKHDLPWTDQWQWLETSLKNGDLVTGFCDAEEVMGIQMLVREFDGSYSFYVGLADGTNSDFLFKDLNRYENATQAFVTFALSLGKETYHACRGALWKMFAGVQANNRLQNSMLNQVAVGMSLLLQPGDGEALDDISVTFNGVFGSVAPGINVVTTKFPDLATEALPIKQVVDRALDNATGQFQSVNAPIPTDQSGNTTKYGLQAIQAHSSSLSSNTVNQFYRSLDKLLNEQFRRIQELPANTTAFPEVAEFYARCKERGVDARTIKKAVRRVSAVRAIGNGSAQLRMLHLDRLEKRLGALDETGRNLATRDSIASDMGRQAADRYLPKRKRVAPDAEVAAMENALLKLDDVPVFPDQNHAVHASIHVPKLLDVVQQIVAQREQQPDDLSPMGSRLQWAMRLQQHASQHVEAMAADPLRVADAKTYSAALEQAGNLIQAYGRELAAQERYKAEQPPEQPQGQPDEPPDPTLAYKAQKLQVETEDKHAESQLQQQLLAAQVSKVGLETEKVGHDMQMKAVETDHKIKMEIEASKVKAPKGERDPEFA